MAISFSGVWQPATGFHYLFGNADWTTFKNKYQELTAQGLRLVTLHDYRQAGKNLWSGVWRQNTGFHYLFGNADWPIFKAKYQELSTLGLRLRSFDVNTSNPDAIWTGIWEEGGGLHQLHVDADWTAFKSKYQELTNQGLRLVALRTYLRGALRLWAGVWREAQGAHYLHVDADQTTFSSIHQQRVNDGMGLISLASYQENGATLFAGAWRAGAGGSHLEIGLTWQQFKTKYDQLSQQGMRLESLAVSGSDSKKTLRIHFKVLTDPSISTNVMLARMREVFGTASIDVELGSVERLVAPQLNDLDVGECVEGQTTVEQQQLFAHRNGASPKDVCLYFVRSTIPPLNGCAAHGQLPAAVVVQFATKWTLAHEVGHVLKLRHVDDNARLMTGNGTANIIEPPRLIDSEISKMHTSGYLQG